MDLMSRETEKIREKRIAIIDEKFSRVEELFTQDILKFCEWYTEDYSALDVFNSEANCFDYVETSIFAFKPKTPVNISKCYFGFRGIAFSFYGETNTAYLTKFNPFATIDFSIEDSFCYGGRCKEISIEDISFAGNELEIDVIDYLIKKRNAIVNLVLEKAYQTSINIINLLKGDKNYLDIISNFFDTLPDNIFGTTSGYLKYRSETLDEFYRNYFHNKEAIDELTYKEFDISTIDFDELKQKTEYLCEFVAEKWEIPNWCVHSLVFAFLRREKIIRCKNEINETCNIRYSGNNKNDYILNSFESEIFFLDDYGERITLAWSLADDNNFDIPFYDSFFENLDLIDTIAEEYINSKKKSAFLTSLTKSKENISAEQKSITIEDVDLMTGAEFEELIALIFKNIGFAVSLTKGSGDQGIDVIAEKENLRIGIQAKCYGGSVGNAAVQEVVAGIGYYNLNKAIVVTNNEFTPAAVALAQANNVVLWDRTILKEKLLMLNS